MPLPEILRQELKKHANPIKAREMQSYMKSSQAFYGIGSPLRRKILSATLKNHPILTRASYQKVVKDLWQGEFREEMYLALDIIDKYRKYADLSSLPLYLEMLQTAAWWDTLDWLVGKILSTLALRHPELLSHAKRWRSSKNLWLRRAALLIQLKHKAKTDTVFLQESIFALASDPDFFIRKAIGWMLREYSKTNGSWVKDFLKNHRPLLSPLSIKEAMKHL